MNHPIKLTPLFCVAALFLAAGCGESNAEKLAKEKERQRIELEKQAQADAAKANKAITTNNQKMFSKMNSSSPGSSSPESAQKAPEPPSEKK